MSSLVSAKWDFWPVQVRRADDAFFATGGARDVRGWQFNDDAFRLPEVGEVAPKRRI